MPIPLQRDPEVTAKAVATWLEGVVAGAHDVRISNLCAPPTSGFSNETILADASWTDADGQRRTDELVVRVKPTGYKVFMESDFDLQHRLLGVLDRDSPVPVPPLLFVEPDPGPLGAPFFVMRKVAGNAAPDRPPYNEEGWLADATPEHRRLVWRSAIDALVAVHNIPPETVAFLAKPELGPTGFDQIFEYWRRSFAWAAHGDEFRIAAAALDWMESNLPADRPTSLSWGDARIGNMLFEDGQVRAVVDWEMLSLGGAEMDLGWWLFLDQFHSFDVPRLEGLGSRAETIELWEAGTGRAATNLDWYEVFAGFRFAIVLMRIEEMFHTFGIPGSDAAPSGPAPAPATTSSRPEPDNAVLRLLAGKLDIEPPRPLPR